MIKQRVFSGVQPTGDLHLGNYLGAIKHFAALQDEHDCLFCVVDQHAITDTMFHGPGKLRQQSREIAAAYIACGVNTKKSAIFIQSSVREHAELAWILSCVARMGWLNRMTQFKDKKDTDNSKEGPSVGLFTYPVLMAADILTYRADLVPVGSDQKQHLELAIMIAQKFNRDSSNAGGRVFFPIPKPLISETTARIMSLQDGTKKMSKSDPNANSRINLLDDNDTIARKIKKATADTQPIPDTLEGIKPEVENLIGIYAALCDTTKEAVLQEYAGKGYGVFKPALSERVVATVEPIRTAMQNLLADEWMLDLELTRGAAKAQAIAGPNLAIVREIVGFQQ